MSTKKKSVGAGLIALALTLAGKFVPKFFGIFAKLFKGVKFGKVGMATASFGAWSLFFSWEFVVVLMGSLFIHECGHIWAMKRCGLKTRGIYFIPFVGGVAVADESFGSRGTEMFVAIVGPIWGFATALAVYALYDVTGEPLYAGIASWIAMVNLFNLLPIHPLDGGRIMQSIFASISSRAGIIAAMFGLLLGLCLSIEFGLYLITLMIFIGAGELYSELQNPKKDTQYKAIIQSLSNILGCEPTAEDIERRVLECFTDLKELRIPLFAMHPFILDDTELLYASEAEKSLRAPVPIQAEGVLPRLSSRCEITKKGGFPLYNLRPNRFGNESFDFDLFEHGVWVSKVGYSQHLKKIFCLYLFGVAMRSAELKPNKNGVYKKGASFELRSWTKNPGSIFGLIHYLKDYKLKSTGPRKRMSPKLIIASAASYVGLSLVLLYLMHVCSINPAAKAAFDFFTI